MTDAAAELGRLIEAQTGLDAGIVGAPALQRALSRRAAARGLDAAEYVRCAVLKTAPATTAKAADAVETSEWDELLDEILIPESWFFRDTEPFRCLAAFALARADAWRRPLRVLSAPCAAGEEPYSAAMALLEAGFAPGSFQVDAIDIGAGALARARAGIYRDNAFRREGLELRERYFEALPADSGTQWRIKSPPLGCVAFAQSNLLDAAVLLARAPYDAIFCRNLLIYLKRDAREKLVGALADRLRPGGLLFVGYAEPLHGLSERFEAVPHPHAYAYRLKDPAVRDASKITPCEHAMRAAKPPAPRHAPRSPQPEKRRHSKPTPAALPSSGPPVPAPVPAPAANHADVPAAAQRLADAGRLAEARELLSAHVARTGAGDSNAWCLLGMLHESQGRAREAEECYNKSLYLDASCYEALVHLAFLAEQRGDSALAARLRRRAGRVPGGDGAAGSPRGAGGRA